MLRTQIVAGEKYMSIADFKEFLNKQQGLVALAGLSNLLDPAIAVGSSTTIDTFLTILDTL